MKATVAVDSFPDQRFKGWVGFVSPVAEFTPKAIQTEELRTSLVYEVRVFVDDPQDELIDETNRRYTALAMLLRSRYLVDVDCWSEVRGRPIKPGTVVEAVKRRLERKESKQ
jgi:hypothetical protein